MTKKSRAVTETPLRLRESDPYARIYKPRLRHQQNDDPEVQEAHRRIRKKIATSMLKRLGSTAPRMQLRSHALRQQARRVYVANLIANSVEDTQDNDDPDITREAYRAFAAKSLDPEIPQSFIEATSEAFIDNFGPAIDVELDSIRVNRVFRKPIKRKPGMKPLGVRWVFDIKRRKDGTVERYKARLVAKGYTQVWGESYTDTFAPTPSKEAQRLILWLAAKYRLPTFQGDVKTAFLYGEMEEEVYCEIPDGWISEEGESLDGMVLPMAKTLYGTKQASRAWQKKLRENLREMGFESVEADPCIFIKRPTKDKFIILVVYVDDVFGTSNDPNLITWFNSEMNNRFIYSKCNSCCVWCY